jgi:uncharacterized protein (DUF3820 family)
MEVTRQLLNEMVITKMPFGQYQDTMICNLPVTYLEGLERLGYPGGKLGILLQALYELKQSGSEHILEAFKKKVAA